MAVLGRRTSFSRSLSTGSIVSGAYAQRRCNPGIIETKLTRHLSANWLHARVAEINQQRRAAGKGSLQWKSTAQGAAKSVWAAVVAAANEVGGQYCEDCHVGEIVPDEVPTSAMTEGVRGYAVDLENAEALWKKSEEMVGESF